MVWDDGRASGDRGQAPGVRCAVPTDRIWNILYDLCTDDTGDRQQLVNSTCELLETERRRSDPGDPEIWRCIWEKPFWAHARASIAGPAILVLKRAGLFHNADHVAGDDWAIDFDEATGRFLPTGRLAQAFCDRQPPYDDLPLNGIVRMPRRVYIVREWARALPTLGDRVRSHLARGAPSADALRTDLQHTRGVGPATAMHALTALGIESVKPDTWVTRFWWCTADLAGHPPCPAGQLWANVARSLPDIIAWVGGITRDHVNADGVLAGGSNI